MTVETPPPEAGSGPRPRVVDRMPEHWARVHALRTYADGKCGAAERIPEVRELSDVGGTWLEALIWRRIEAREADGSKAVRYTVKACLANAHTILLHDPRWKGVLAYDDFAECVSKTRLPPWSAPLGAEASGEWTEVDGDRLRAWLDHAYGFTIGAQDAAAAVPNVVAEAQRIHPVRAYLEGVKWDGTQRLPTVLATHFGAADTPYTRAIGVRWFISAVARLFDPGCQADCTLILESSQQGWRKSSAFRALVPWAGLYSETGITIGDKDSYQALRNVWIFGFDELAALRRSDVVRTRTFLTATHDRYRPSYGRRVKVFPRQCVFVGTTNEYEYLADPAGNRRFLPVRLERPADDGRVRAERDQLWAEAYARYTSGEAWWIDSDELRVLCADEQAARVVPDEWVGAVATWLQTDAARGKLDERGGVLLLDVLHHALGVSAADASKGEQARAADALRALMYERGPRRREGNANVRRWYPVEGAEVAGRVCAGCGSAGRHALDCPRG